MAQTLTDVFDIRVQFPIDLRLVKSDLNGRNGIEQLQRYEGLAVWVVTEQKLYRLIGGITNDDWVDQTPTNAGLQSVTVSTSTPTGGNPGDIHFKNVEGGTEVWYNNAGTWGIVGTLPSGSPTYTSDPSTPNTSALSYLNTTYPDANPGDQVYKVASGMRRTWTCYAPGEWSRIDEVIET